MTVPGGPRKPNPWPFLAISVLVLLLGAFLVLQFLKPDRTPATVKEPPAPVEAPPPTEASASPGEPAPVPKGPSLDDQLDALVARIEKAAGERKWEEAEGELRKARALAVKDERLDALRHRIDEGRQEERRQAEEKQRKFDDAFAAMKESAEGLMRKEKYEAALAEAETFRKAEPYAEKNQAFQKFHARVKGIRDDARDVFESALKEAKAHLAAGRQGAALKALQKGRLLYPEGDKEIAAIEAKIKEDLLFKDMVRIPEQLCWIGNDEVPEEAPLRRVKLPSFYIDKHLVTNTDYAAFCEATGHRRPPYWRGSPPSPHPKFLKHPVVFVARSDAEAYAKWAGKRLPTAEEWEVAARGFDKRIFPWGNVFAEKENEFPCNCLEFWQLHKQFSRGTTAVDDPRFANNVSPWGVYGMAGNVWEYTSTRVRQGEAEEYAIMKGGSFMAPAKAQRCSNVYADEADLLHPDIGFRCVRDPK